MCSVYLLFSAFIHMYNRSDVSGVDDLKASFNLADQGLVFIEARSGELQPVQCGRHVLQLLCHCLRSDVTQVSSSGEQPDVPLTTDKSLIC